MKFAQQDLFDTGTAANAGTAIGQNFTDAGSIAEFVNALVAYAFLLAGALSVVFIFWGGIKLIISGGEDEKVKTAIGTIRHALIGLVVTIFSFTVVAFLGGVFGLDLVGYISREKIFELITSLTSQ